ncbi:hypothetical protein AAG570_013300 [Ranatra chinensis]|uniref:Potassium channel domain-containing protein n=1 Tax=Ranatra chinensis TaxID=642074 RepID=A0ABD0YSU8_9HEMI
MRRKRGSRRSLTRRRKTWGQRFKDYLRRFVAFMFSNVGIIGLVVGYTIAGSFIFIAIEKNNYTSRAEEVLRLRNETAARLWLTTCCEINVFSEENWRNRVHVELVHFQKSIVEAVQIYGYEGEEMAGNRWSFSGAFLYSLTVITTIGYGNVAPRTEWGKLTTILYAIAGMPLFLLYLSNIGDILAKSFKWIYAKCCLCKGCQRRRHLITIQQQGLGGIGSADDVSENSSVYDPQSVTVPITLCLAIMVG